MSQFRIVLLLLLSACSNWESLRERQCVGSACSDAANTQDCAWCTPGTAACRNGNVAFCMSAASCSIYAEEENCPAGETCSFGRCSTSCIDECAAGEVRCAGPSAVEVCGQADSDSCLDWVAPMACVQGQLCSNGRCASTCVSECEVGTVRCRDIGIATCTDTNGDGCNEWGPAVGCATGQSCEGSAGPRGAATSAQCTAIASCVDACSANSCLPSASGMTFSVCGNYDLDPCLELSPGFGCIPLACETASCEPSRGCVITNVCSSDGGVDGSTMSDAQSGNDSSIDANADASTPTNDTWGAFATATWVSPAESDAQDHFGRALSVTADGSFVASGAPYEDSDMQAPGAEQPTNNRNQDSGGVYVFQQSGQTRSLHSLLKAAITSGNSRFGTHVSIGHDTVLHRVVGSTQSGAIFTFQRTAAAPTTWTAAGSFQPVRGIETLSSPEVRLSANGNRLLIGAPSADEFNVSNCGSVLTYDWNGSAWVETAVTTSTPRQIMAGFGSAIALAADGLTFAASIGDGSDATGINGDRELRGAPNSGAVFVFRYNGTAWIEEAYIKASNTGTNDFFGASVALSPSGNLLVVGAPSEDSASRSVNGDETNNDLENSGAAYVFRREGSTWTQVAYVKAANADAQDAFGQVVAAASDTLIAVSSLTEDSSAPNINGDAASNATIDSGAVYIYRVMNGSWQQTEYIKSNAPTSAASFGGTFGASLAFAPAARRLYVGAYQAGIGGRVFVYQAQ